eukprot:3941022-Rhodomonas_salina.2
MRYGWSCRAGGLEGGASVWRATHLSMLAHTLKHVTEELGDTAHEALHKVQDKLASHVSAVSEQSVNSVDAWADCADACRV